MGILWIIYDDVITSLVDHHFPIRTLPLCIRYTLYFQTERFGDGMNSCHDVHITRYLDPKLP